MKLLYINACMREDSRTAALTRRYLADKPYEIDELKLEPLALSPLDGAALAARDRDIQENRLDGEDYALARQFAQAEEILIAAPYWDASFPAKLKIYLERVCVCGLTFAYGENGSMVKKCRAHRLTYITTAGGFLRSPSSVKLYLQELCSLFSIEDLRFYAAQGLDAFPDRTEEILQKTLQKMA